MSLLAMFLNAGSLAHAELKRSVASGMGGVGYRKNRMTVRVGRALLLAYAAQHKAKRDISRLLSM